MSLYIPESFYEATISLASLHRPPDLQVRAVARMGELQIRRDIVEDYRRLYEDGKDLGPLVVVEEINEDGTPTGRFLLADGHHRFEALRQMGRTSVQCRIYQGDEFTAVLLAARENGRRGLEFRRLDNKQAVRVLLHALANQGTTWSNQEIANQIGIERATVRTVRIELKKLYGSAIPDAADEQASDGGNDNPLSDERPI